MAKWSLEKLNSCRGRAEAGEIEAQTFLGWAYIEGKFVEKDNNLAKEWLKRASDQGSKEATYRLAFLLASRKDGNGIEMLRGLSAECFAPAAYELGNYYYVGLSVERDVGAAVREWSRAAEAGHALARIKLLKYQSLHSPFYKKPLLFLRLLWAVMFLVSILARDLNDPRVLGSLR
jgi:FOG: TPR repeat, SEL1 subfamily